MDIAINKNGSFLIDGTTSGFGIVNSINYYKQSIYIALMEMDPRTISSKRFNSVDETIRNLKSYLNYKLELVLPFSIELLLFRGNRNNDESISIKIDIPPELGEFIDDLSIIDLKFDLKEGYLQQLDYAFAPNTTTTRFIEKRVTEIIKINNPKIRIPLKHRYSGRGVIRFYDINSDEQVLSENITIIKENDYLEYNLLDYVKNIDFNIDNAFIRSGKDFLEKTTNSPEGIPNHISYRDGVPFIYFKENTPNGEEVEINITCSNCISFSNVVEGIKDDSEMAVFGLKLINDKYLTTLVSPLPEGEYKAIYWANIYYEGSYR